MAMKEINAVGLKCPQPVLKLAAMMPQIAPGDIVAVSGDCSTFEADMRKWAERMKKTILSVTRNGDVLTIQVQF